MIFYLLLFQIAEPGLAPHPELLKDMTAIQALLQLSLPYYDGAKILLATGFEGCSSSKDEAKGITCPQILRTESNGISIASLSFETVTSMLAHISASITPPISRVDFVSFTEASAFDADDG